MKTKIDFTNCKLDLGCGEQKQTGFIGIDKVANDKVDLVWDLEVTPYPIPDNSATIMIASHIIEHLKPWLFIGIMDEWWRIMQPEGQLMIATPYAGSPMFWQDPTHIAGFNEVTFTYFDPLEAHVGNINYNIYRPKPWKIIKSVWDMGGTLEVAMEKRHNDTSYQKK